MYEAVAPFSGLHRRALPQWARDRCPTNGRCGAESGGVESGDAFTNERWETDPAPVGTAEQKFPHPRFATPLNA